MIVLEGFIEVLPNELALIQRELKTHIELTRAEPGCISFVIEQDAKNRCFFNVYEEFESQQAFDAHQARVKGSRWGLVSKNVIRHYRVVPG